ncbi:MAG: DMT family transporter [Gammaproteobacteria bacterium]|nr:DMT family transporter [Gammaproteobacteria bacterium]NIR90636.1 DMT family transporter [Gammaproteobacteria bacterium]NIU07016.1 DMT family transporter [Gammaproteobacteria bacterium]NIV53926.1 EamA family transporter [Gammaproteobacteria bacterium]NIW86156.1 EamA family transporter [Gammaproteobacteria bacterium]
MVLTVLAGAMLASMDAVGKYLTADLDVLQIVWARYTFHTLIVLGVLAARGGLGFVRARRPGLQTLRGGALLGATLCLYTALAYVPLADATAVQFFAPVLVTVLSGIFLREHVGARRIAAVLAGFGGVLLIVRPGLAGGDWHMLLPLGAACMLALYLLLTRRLSGADDSRTTLFYTTALGAVLLTLVVPAVWRTPAPEALALMIAMGALGATAHLGLIIAFGFAPASVLSPFLYAQLVWAGVVSVLYFGDPLTPPMIIGALVLVVSGLYIWWRESVGPADVHR